MGDDTSQPICAVLPRGIFSVLIRKPCGTVERIVNSLEHERHVQRALELAERHLGP